MWTWSCQCCIVLLQHLFVVLLLFVTSPWLPTYKVYVGISVDVFECKRYCDIVQSSKFLLYENLTLAV